MAIILSAALRHAIWNTTVKTDADLATTLGLVTLGHTLLFAVMVILLPLPSTESFVYMGLPTFVHFGYAKNFAPLRTVSALRETLAIFATLIGFFLLKEGY